MKVARAKPMTLGELPDRQTEFRDAAAAPRGTTIAAPTIDDIKAFQAFLNSPAGKATINRFHAPELAPAPVLRLDRATTRAVHDALTHLPATPRPAAAAAGLGPRETVAISGAGGMLAGAGAAHILNSLRHVDPTGVGSILFAVAGAALGGGMGALLGARVVKSVDLNTPVLKVKLVAT